MDIKALADKYNDYIIERRRYYHTCPELSNEEKRPVLLCIRTSRLWASRTSRKWNTATA